MLSVRELVLVEIPSVSETVNDVSYAVTNGFTFSGRVKEVFCYVVAYSSYVNLGFARGAELSDPDRKLQGTGKLHRHLRIETPADLDRPEVRRFHPSGRRSCDDRRRSSSFEANRGSQGISSKTSGAKLRGPDNTSQGSGSV